MRTIKLTLLLLMIIACIKTSKAQESAHTVKVIISNITSNDGYIRVGLYNTASNFLTKTYKPTRIKAKTGSVEVYFINIPAGEYAISLYHDIDDNKRLNTLFKIPTEPYATSNNAKGIFGPPKWVDAKFYVKDTDLVQNISL